MGMNSSWTTRINIWLLVGLVAASPLISVYAFQNKQPPIVKTPEPVFRKLISKLVMPTYPDEAKNRGEQGTAVVEVYLDEEGRLTDVKILEAPSAQIGDSVVNAIRQSKFTKALSDNGPVRVAGKLTFYFVIERGHARVNNPKKFK